MSGGIRFGWPWRLAACFGVLGAAAPFAAIPVAQAGNVEYCVTCKNPNASYRCRLQGSGVSQSDAFKLYCVVKTTKDGDHASCSAKKKPGCKGVVKVYNYDGPGLPAKDPRLRQLNERLERDNQAFEDKRGDQPNSLIELGGRAYDASKRGLQGAGAAIGLGGDASTSPQARPTQATPSPRAAPSPPAARSPSAKAEPPPQKNFAHRSWDCMASLFRECGENK